jgi:DNA repair photolyase
MNLYRGCTHRCIYCDSRSECYQIEDFDGEILVKTNAIERLKQELTPRRQRGRIGTGSMNDPYQAVERKFQLTRQALAVIAERGFPVHIITKSDLVTRDLDLLQEINREQALVSFTLTTVDDELARKVEPFAPLPSARLRAMRSLRSAGIRCGVTMMPILPWIEDNPDNISAILHAAADAGAEYVLPAFGMSMRDRQRDYYYARLDELFPELSRQYRQRYGNQYQVPAPNAAELYPLFTRLRTALGLADHIPQYQYHPPAQQPALF